VGAFGSLSTPPRGAAIDVLKIGGGHSRISDTASQGAHHARFFPPRDILQLGGGRSQISVNVSHGVCHRHLQDRWWVLSDLWQRLLGGSAIDVFKMGGGCSWISVNASQGGHYRRLQDRWWELSDLLYRLLGSPPHVLLPAMQHPATRWWALSDLRQRLPRACHRCL
jgi:hypothetical protein